jgi:exodeoxyribonuclease V alpha subunit
MPPRPSEAALAVSDSAASDGSREAAGELTAFAEKWRVVHPDLASDPDRLATQVGFLHGRRIEDQTEAYIARQIQDAHPEADQIRQADHDTYAAYEQAQDAAARLDAQVYDEVRPHGRAAFLTDLDEIGERLSSVAHESRQVSRDVDAVLIRVGRLQQEPSIRALPEDALATAHDQWAADREHARNERRRADVHGAKVRARLRREAREPDFGYQRMSQPDHGRGIGR